MLEQLRFPVVGPVIEAVAALLLQHRQAFAARAELAQLSDSDIAAIARELTIPTGRLRSIAGESPDLPRRLKTMLSALGVTPQTFAAADPRLTGEMPSLCRRCPSKSRCDRDLAVGTELPKPYCANADALKAMVSDQTQSLKTATASTSRNTGEDHNAA